MKNEKTATLTLPTDREGSEARRGGTRPASRLDRWLAEKVLQMAGNPPLRLTLWDGTALDGGGSRIAAVHVRDRAAFYQLLRNPALHFGDLYSVGRIEVEGDLVEFLATVYTGMDRQD